jgi:hypothetical protein
MSVVAIYRQLRIAHPQVGHLNVALRYVGSTQRHGKTEGTKVTSHFPDFGMSISFRVKIEDMRLEVLLLVWRLDCLSCVLTVLSTILIGRRCWTGWVLAQSTA